MLAMLRVKATSRSITCWAICDWWWMPNQPPAASSAAPKQTMAKPPARRVETFRSVSFMVGSLGKCGFGLRRGCGGIDELHVRARHEALDVGEDEHALAHRAEAGDESGVE